MTRGTAPGLFQERRAEVDQMHARQLRQGSDTIERGQVRPGAAAEFDHARAGGNFQVGDECLAAMQQTGAEGVIAPGLGGVEALQAFRVAARARLSTRHAPEDVDIGDEFAGAHGCLKPGHRRS